MKSTLRLPAGVVGRGGRRVRGVGDKQRQRPRRRQPTPDARPAVRRHSSPWRHAVTTGPTPRTRRHARCDADLSGVTIAPAVPVTDRANDATAFPRLRRRRRQRAVAGVVGSPTCVSVPTSTRPTRSRRPPPARPRWSSSSSPTRRAGSPRSRAPTPTRCARRDVDIYIHAPYRINVATLNNRIRIPSRKLLMAARHRGRRGRRQGPDRPRWTRRQGRRHRGRLRQLAQDLRVRRGATADSRSRC